MRFPTKRLHLLAFLMAVSVLILSGCGGSKASSPSSTTASSSVNASQEETITGLTAKGLVIKEMSYELVSAGAGVSLNSKAWLKDKKMKADTTFNGQRTISLFDLANNEVITYLPGEKMATKIKVAEYQGQDNVTPLDYTKLLNNSSFKIVGAENVGGLECQVITGTIGQVDYKQWLSTQYGIVVKIETKLNGEISTLEYQNIKVGAGTVPENTFDLPQGIEIIVLDNIMRNTKK